MKKLNTLYTGLFVLASVASVQAGGYQLNEYSATGLGRAFAGAGIVGDDYSAIAFNPAGMTLKGTGGQVGMTTVQLHGNITGHLVKNSDSSVINGPEAKMNLFKTLPSFFAQHKINEKWFAGFGVYTPFGLATKYDYKWFGATHGTTTELEVLDLAPAVAYRPIKQLSIGASLIFRYVHGNLINELPMNYILTGMHGSSNQMDLDGWDTAYNFGIMYEPTQTTRFGVSYRRSWPHTVKGKNRIKGAIGPLSVLNNSWEARSRMQLPDQLTLSAFHKLNDKVGLSATAKWTRWSVFDDFILYSDVNGGTTSVIPEKWENVWSYSLGLDYYFNKNWTFRVGTSYDPTPVSTAKYRTARIPDNDRFWLTAGASYTLDKITVDVGYSHLFMKTGMIDNNDGYTTLKGKVKSYSNMFGLQVQYDF